MRIHLSRPHMSGHEEGSAALHLALRIAGVGPGDEVWISSMTFAGGIFPINYLGARPRFFDLDPASWTLDPGLLAEELAHAARENRLPRAIVPTDIYGQSADLDPLESLAAQHGVRLIVDSAESFGAEYRGGRKAGTGGDAAILSFNGNKIITTSGGGMLVTRHEDWADQARFLATQARDPAPHYEHSTFGYNYRLSNICAAIGLGQMEVLDARAARRRAIFARYREALAHPGLAFMPEPEGLRSTRWLTALTIDPGETGRSREDIRLMLLGQGIESRPLWKPMHLQPLYAGAPYHGRGFDERLFETGLCLPSGSDMLDDQQDEVIGHICALLDGGPGQT
ncbi:MAG: pyridoxal phosphate-dependent aminotransferase [Alphaproteobacteria bacterium HGW-Alphaproteobacteria-2]|nr:MAG: pyridoxal phosphate-dependent aminotransferase [Alphaproteobacteria bacterium HGW-Alphaproteobacteria-2]